MRTLCLHPPSYEGFDGGAGSRYQAKREIRSFWYPTWLAQVAALVPGSKLVDAPAAGLGLDEVLPLAGQYDLAVLHTSSPSFAGDVQVAEALKRANPALKLGFVGAKVAVEPERSLLASEAIDFVAREEFDFTIAEIAEGRPLEDVRGLTFRGPDGQVMHTPDRPILEDMDRLPYVTDVYRRDLNVDDYFIGYLKHPYVSLYTGRGCRSRCTFCLWPQTVGGHRYRTRSAEHVLGEMARITELFPSVREVFFDDDTFTDDRRRAEEIARGMGRLGLTWSCNAKANVPYETLTVLRENGLRLLLVGYESGNQQILINIKKGVRVERARQFTKDCRDLGITIHGTFIVGLPGETAETIQETIRFAKEINPHSLQVSIAAPYPGTALYQQAKDNGWLPGDSAALIDEHGVQAAALSYPSLNRTEIYDSVETFYRQFYFRAGKIAEMSAEMVRSPEMMRRPAARGSRVPQLPAAARQRRCVSTPVRIRRGSGSSARCRARPPARGACCAAGPGPACRSSSRPAGAARTACPAGIGPPFPRSRRVPAAFPAKPRGPEGPGRRVCRPPSRASQAHDQGTHQGSDGRGGGNHRAERGGVPGHGLARTACQQHPAAVGRGTGQAGRPGDSGQRGGT